LVAKSLSGETAAACTNSLWAIYGKNKDYDEAITYINAWGAAHPSDPSPHWWEGWYQRQKSDEEAALAAYTRCWEVSGKKWASAAADIGEQHRRMAYSKPQGDGEARLEDVKELEAAVDWLCRAQAIPWNWGAPDREPIAKCIQVFLACANGGYLDEGARMLEEKCLKVAPDNWQILNNLGLYYRDAGGRQRDKALCDKSRKYYVKAADLVSNDANASGNWKARVLNDAGVLYHFPMYMVRDMETGMKYYMKALTFDPEWIDANENMGICMNALGKYEEAIPYLQKALKQEPDRLVSMRELRKARRALNDK
jgi:tetratricopeptide (TPR) repeat protein